MRLNPCEKWLVRTYLDLVSEGGGGGFLISPAILRNPLRPWDLCTPVRLLLDRISDRTQGVTKRYRLFFLTNSALVYESKCGGLGWLRGLFLNVSYEISLAEVFGFLFFRRP
jgi:hypothetical protein